MKSSKSNSLQDLKSLLKAAKSVTEVTKSVTEVTKSVTEVTKPSFASKSDRASTEADSLKFEKRLAKKAMKLAPGEFGVGCRVVFMDAEIRGVVTAFTGDYATVLTNDGFEIKEARANLVVVNEQEEKQLRNSRVTNCQYGRSNGRSLSVQSSNGRPSYDESSYGRSSYDRSSYGRFSYGRSSNGRFSNGRFSDGRSSNGVVVSSNGDLIVDLHIEALPGGRNVAPENRLSFQLEVFRRVLRENLRHRGMHITFIHGVGDGILKSTILKELEEVYALRCTWNATHTGATTVSIK